MTDIETRVTSATGGEKGQKSARLGGADPKAMRELALVYGFGEEKYARFNYLKGYDWSLSIDALYRHFLAFQAGEDRDEESGLLHMAHVAWHALALTAFQLRSIGSDDRFRPDISKMDQMIGLGLHSRAYYLEQFAGVEDPKGDLAAARRLEGELCACHKPGVGMGDEHARFVKYMPMVAHATLIPLSERPK